MLDRIDALLPSRPRNAHKGMFGHVLVLGGDLGMPGAVRLSAEGALRVGAGIVTVGTRAVHIAPVVCGRPELMCYGLEKSFGAQLKALIARASVIVLGPGLGQSAWSKRCFDLALKAHCAVVIDADGLTLLSHTQMKRNNWILTPHPGEAARLLGCTTADVQANRIETVNLLAARFGGVIVLKGMRTLIGTQGQAIQCCEAGNPGMASPGMGDLLTGIIAGFVAQGIELIDAAALGVWIHATAADKVAERQGERGLLAGDVLSELSSLLTFGISRNRI